MSNNKPRKSAEEIALEIHDRYIQSIPDPACEIIPWPLNEDLIEDIAKAIQDERDRATRKTIPQDVIKKVREVLKEGAELAGCDDVNGFGGDACKEALDLLSAHLGPDDGREEG